MSSTASSATALAVDGAASCLFLLIAALLWRDRRGMSVARLGAILACSAAAHTISSMPGFWASGLLWQLPVLTMSRGAPAAFWLWARSAFDDEFRPRAWHGLLWAALAGGGLFVAYGTAAWPRSGAAVNVALSLGATAFAFMAVLQTITTWSADLVAGRRRLRIAVLIGTSVFVALQAVSELARLIGVPERPDRGVAGAVAVCALALLAAWNLFRVGGRDQSALLLQTSADALGEAVARAPAPIARLSAADPALLQKLERLMEEERIHRQDSLTIGSLASRLGVSEHRLRQTINEGLGHRNFNAFVNRFRIEEAKVALADPAQESVPVLTIAMDAGFQSIGPFNRAFKADTGMTPTEYRRAALPQFGAAPEPNPL